MLPSEDSHTIHNASIAAFMALFFFDIFVWHQIVFAAPPRTAQFYFLDIGQGDSELVIFPGGVSVLTDAGPKTTVVGAIEKVIPTSRRYIDLAVVSHPQLDHFEGFIALLDQYEFGAFITNGRDDDPGVKEWPALLQKIKEKHIPIITLAGGDRIRNGESNIDILSPDSTFIQSAELNDTGFVELIRASGVRALLTADTGFVVEHYLAGKYDIFADILKVGHHGSKYSTSDEFLAAVHPKIAVIEVGARNTYGHPAPQTVSKLLTQTSGKLLRTDKNGTVSIIPNGAVLRVFAERPGM